MSDRERLLAKLKEFKKLSSEWAMYLYAPYPKQVEFHNMKKRERALLAGNQLGKCVTFQTLIPHPDGSVTPAGELYRRGSGFRVWSWDGSRVVVAEAVGVIRKPGEECFRVWLADGNWFECAGRHRVLTSAGYVFCDSLLASLPNLRASSWVFSRLIRGAGVLRWWETARGFLAGCLFARRLCGGPLPSAAGSGRGFVPSPGDALRRNCQESGWDGCSTIGNGSPLRSWFRRSSLDAAGRSAGRSVGFSGSAIGTAVRSAIHCIRAFWRLRPALLSALRSGGAVLTGQSAFFSLVDPLKRGNQIVAYEPIGVNDLYDFTVPGYHNYIAAGVVHHNTMSAAHEVAFHMTGVYPAWWAGERFDAPVTVWVGSETAELTRDGAQIKLIGAQGQFGSGAIPKPLLEEPKMARGSPGCVELFAVRHVSGGLSQGVFKAFADGREKWQAGTVHVVWMDEEPAIEIYTEAVTRTNATNGIVMSTLTPLKGMSDVVIRVMRPPEGTSIGCVQMTIDDVGHYSEAKKREIIATYLPHEREARARGIPMLGSGRVFPVPEEWIVTPSIVVPDHWKRLIGVDFGWDHPTAAVLLALDPEADCLYVGNCYRQSRETPLIHAAAVKPWGKYPVAWPHDALQHDKGSGEQLASIYKKHGLRMLSERAQFPDDRGHGVEAGLTEMLERMQTGRFKVMDHCVDWLEEFRAYHRKDGKVVKEREDLMSACLHPLTMVWTDSGKKAIVDLAGTTGRVLSLDGKWCEYSGCYKTRENAPLLNVEFDDGSSVLCTAEHRFMTDSGWICAVDLEGEWCHTAVTHSIGGEPCALLPGPALNRNSTASDIGNSEIISGAAARSFTAPYGNTTMARFRLATTFITRITTATTTISKIWNALKESYICRNIIKDTKEGRLPLLQHWWIGEKHRPAETTCGNPVYATPMPCTFAGISYANAAAVGLPQKISGKTAFAVIGAGPNRGVIRELITRIKSALSAPSRSAQTATAVTNSVPARVPEKIGLQPRTGPHTSRVLRVTKSGNSDVYCLTVPETEAFAIGNGVLVHNSRYAMMMLRYAVPKVPEEKKLDRYSRRRRNHGQTWMSA